MHTLTRWHMVLLNILLVLVWQIWWVLLPPPIQAQENDVFETRLVSTYQIGETGVTTVKLEYTLTNTSPTLYVSQYSYTTTLPSISNVRVEEGEHTIIPTITYSGVNSTISFHFPEVVVGEGKQRIFSISYETPSLAIITGNILEVRIPHTNQTQVYAAHTTILQVPTRFGSPARINVQPNQIEKKQEYSLFYFENPKQSITAFFGDAQTFQLTLRYSLENSTASKVINQVAFPPDTQYQHMQYQQIEPLPQHIKTDDDGNWIGSYELPPHSRITVIVQAFATVSLNQNPTIPIPPPSSQHTQAREYWPIHNPEIVALTRQLQHPRDIYNHVISSLTYDYTRSSGPAERLGAIRALQQPDTAICQEFTDVFITLARANGIPARRLTGYGYSDNQALRPLVVEGDVLHAWPEFFDNTTQSWKQIDPTWQYTTGGNDYFDTFDVNHIVFSINGVSSTRPFPAGSYKTSTEQHAQDVVVRIADAPSETKPLFALNLEQKKLLGVSLPGIYTLSITNKTGVAWYNVSHSILSADASSHIDTNGPVVHHFLPYQTARIDVIVSNLQAMRTMVDITLIHPEQDIPINIHEQTTSLPIPQFIKITPNAIFFLVFVCIIITLTIGSILVLKRR